MRDDNFLKSTDLFPAEHSFIQHYVLLIIQAIYRGIAEIPTPVQIKKEK